MRKIFFLIVCTCTVIITAAQTITGPGSGLNRPTTATATLALGGTVTAATTLDFTTNTTANFLIKKGTANYLFIGNTGLTGIGTATPTSLFSLGSAVGNSKLAVWDNGTTLRSGLGWQAAQFRLHLSATTDKFSFFSSEAAAAGTDLMTILGTGNVGINVAAPTQKLDVGGTVKSTGLILTTGTPALGKFLTSTDAGGLATWSTTLPIANGGTGLTTAVATGDILYADATNATAFTRLGIGTANQVLTVSAIGKPSWVTPAAGGAISSVFGRTGAVVAAANDYTFAQIAAKPTTLAGYGITDAAALSHTHAIDVLSNVTITTPVNNQVLTYNSASAKWVNQTAAAGGTGWALTGNAGTIPGTHFIGTTDAQSLVFKTNNIQSGKIDIVTNNTSFGQNSLNGTSTGVNNSAFGVLSLTSNTTGYENNALGLYSLNKNTTGYQNTANGTYTLYNNTTGYNNIAIGKNAGYSNVSGFENSFFGINTGYANTTGVQNTFVGFNAGMNNNAGGYNSYLGFRAGFNNTSGFNNSIIGSYAGQDFTDASNNTLLGYNTGRGITVGSSNTIVGANVQALPGGLNNNIILADGQGNRRINVDANGNTGIGTITPTAKLDIRGTYTTPDLNGFSTAGNVLNVYSTNTNGAGVGGVLALGGNTGLSTATYPFAFIQGAQQTAGEYGGILSFWTTSNGGINGEVNSANYQRMVINKIGNIGIGTVNAMDPDYRLFVEKGIRTRKVKVDITAWPDYVFKPSYKLTPLNELEIFLLKNQHLPDVPSATEVEKNGIDLGTNQAILLKKVEELTLYMIDLNKKVEALAKENEELKKKVNSPK
jgi:trimeric autotransporter adhesin